MPPHRPSFVPRVTLLLLLGFALFAVSTLVYVWPVMIEPPPPGAIPTWTQERVQARLRGKLPWIFTGSMLVAAAIGWRWLSPPEDAP